MCNCVCTNVSTKKNDTMNKILTLTTGLILLLSSCSDNRPTKFPDNFEENREKFIATLEIFQASNKISSGLTNDFTNEYENQEQKMKSLINKGIGLSKEISDDFLTFLHPEFSANFRNKLVKSYEIYLDGFTSQSDESTISLQMQTNQLVSDWDTFWENNFDQINNNLSIKIKTTFGQKLKNLIIADKNKKSYWRMVLRLFISIIVSTFIFSFIVIALLLPLAPIGLLTEKINKGLATIISIPFIIIAGLGQAFFWVLWAAYCAYTIQFYMDSPTVSHNWLYYITGFFTVGTPIGWLSSKEKQSTVSYEEQKKIQGGTLYYGLIAVVAFIVFCIWTNLPDYKYISWLNDWLY